MIICIECFFTDSICQRLVEDHDIQDVVVKMTKEFLSNEDVLQAGLVLLAALSKEGGLYFILFHYFVKAWTKSFFATFSVIYVSLIYTIASYIYGILYVLIFSLLHYLKFIFLWDCT